MATSPRSPPESQDPVAVALTNWIVVYEQASPNDHIQRSEPKEFRNNQGKQRLMDYFLASNFQGVADWQEMETPMNIQQ